MYKRQYLDNAATTLRKPQPVIDAVVSAMTTLGNSARGTHDGSLSASRIIYGAREKLAAFFHLSLIHISAIRFLPLLFSDKSSAFLFTDNS